MTDIPAPGRDQPAGVPTATLRPQRRFSWAWILPVLAVVAAGWLVVDAWRQRGVVVTVLLEEGHGIKPGDAVRYRGVTVGEVRAVELTERSGLRITAGLSSGADTLARAGSRFWVVRPQLGLSRIAGIETIVGPRYLAVLPGRGARQRHFVGIEDPPVVETIEPGDLEIIVTASEQRGLRRGAAVTYRQVRVGTVLSVGLTSDGGAVEARVHIDRAFVQLIRRATRFWDVGGVEATVGLTGLTVRADTIETVLTGGVALATPPDAGEVVRTGHRFVLASEPRDEWLDWQPLVAIGSDMLPAGAPLPHPLRATIGWKQGLLISRHRSRHGWVLQTDAGLLGPTDLLVPDVEADQQSAALEVAGTVVSLADGPLLDEGGVAALDVRLEGPAWPADRRRRGTAPEDCLAVGDSAAPPLPLAAARLTAGEDGWAVDPAVSLDESWHGAAVVGRADGYLVGLLLVDDGTWRVALLPGEP